LNATPHIHIPAQHTSDIFSSAAKVALVGAGGQLQEGRLKKQEGRLKKQEGRLKNPEHGMLLVTVMVEEVAGTAEEGGATPEQVECILQVV
jgi:hypothetical protein